ncbi:MAG: class I SAM-dependent methyltransferase [Anaerolineales bacterium]
MDVRAYNAQAWDREVQHQNRWTQPVGPEIITRARQGECTVLLTEQKAVPSAWLPPLPGLDVLCLASGGGQQAPILAAAGANVTVFDNSPRQLEQDRLVAKREGLTLRIVEGDAADLSIFLDESFDLVFNPVSTAFMPDVRPVWWEAFRVLRHGGYLLAGMMNPVHYIFDLYKADENILEVKYAVPYSDLTSPNEAERQEYLEQGLPLEFGHSLTDLLGGQCAAGFHIIDLYEDTMSGSPLGQYHPNYLATRALKP